MGFLAIFVEKLFGGWFRWTIVPALIAGLFWTSGKLIKDRDERLRQEGEMACLNKWELANLKVERDAANARAIQAAAEAQASSFVREELRIANVALEMELQEVREAARNSEQRCVSDRVRELVTGGKK